MSGPRGDGGHSSPWRGAGVPRDQRLPGACSSSGVTGKRSRHTGLGGCRVGSSAKDRLSCWHTATGWWAVPGGPAKWDWRVAGGPQSIPPLLCHPPGPLQPRPAADVFRLLRQGKPCLCPAGWGRSHPDKEFDSSNPVVRQAGREGGNRQRAGRGPTRAWPRCGKAGQQGPPPPEAPLGQRGSAQPGRPRRPRRQSLIA